MYHVECIDIHKADKMYLYIDRACLCANNMYNVANFHIRNHCTVKPMTYRDILRASQAGNKTNNNRSNPGQTGQRACVCPVTA